MKARLSLVLVSAAAMAAAADAGAVRYRDGSRINLAAARGAKVTASANCTGMPEVVLHPVFTEARFRSNHGACWLMIELPEAYRLSGHRIGFRSVITSVGYRLKVSTEPLDDQGWTRADAEFEFKGPLKKAHDSHSSGFAGGEFGAVDTRFVRIEFYGHNGSERGEPGRDHADLVLGKVQLWGPNDPVTSPAISMAQSSWAGGRAFLAEPGKALRPWPEANDDMEPGARGWGVVHSTFRARGSPRDPGVRQLDGPARMVVVLRHRAMVEAVAFAANPRQRSDRPRDVKVYVSPHEIGEHWTLQKELRDIEGGEYVEIVFDRPVLARRARFDVERVWNDRIDAGSKTSFGHIGELYVYGTAVRPNITISIREDAMTAGRIFDAGGKLVRTLWESERLEAGSHMRDWDGLTDDGKEAPRGRYELRILANAGRYENVAAIGNTGDPPDADGHVPAHLNDVAVDEDGFVYTANGWDEAGHDWKKWDRTGKAVLHANFRVRNGRPNGLPNRIAVDGDHIYVSLISHTEGGSHWIQRFDKRTGRNALWEKADEHGHIRVYPKPEKKSWENPVTDLAVAGGMLLAADTRGNRVLKYDKATGEKTGEFAVDRPSAMTADAEGRLWIAQDGGSLAVFDLEGRRLIRQRTRFERVTGLDFAGGRLYVADAGAGHVLVLRTRGHRLDSPRILGGKARPGDRAPDRFYKLGDVAATPDGGLVTVQDMPIGGARITQWTAAHMPAWEHMGLEFTGNGNYRADAPDEFVSTYFHRYRLDRKAGGWRFHGNLHTGGYTKSGWWHGAPKWVKLGRRWFFYFAIGDGMSVYRLDGDELRFSAHIGGKEPDVRGEHEGGKRHEHAEWTWADADADGTVDDDEVMWHAGPGEGKYYVFGMNVDVRGNVVYCDHHTRAIHMLPMTGLNDIGNPVYDWSAGREIVPRDETDVKLMPLMAVRTEKEEVYAFGRSELFPKFPGSGPAWMGGWALGKYDKSGKRLWAIRLAQHCTGMDYIPGDRGVILGYFAKATLFHYTADGALVGSVGPGAPAGGVSGWLDNTASVSVSVDPRDGLIDVFAEEDYAHRILWYRIDDRRIWTQRQVIQLR